MPLKHFSIALILILFSKLNAQKLTNDQIIIPHVNPSLKLTENKGQWQQSVLFRAQLDGGLLFLEKNCLTFNFYDKKKYRALHHGGVVKGLYKDLSLRCHSYKIHFENCNVNALVDKAQVGQDYENFYLGNDQKKWASNVRNFHQVFLKDLYAGIDYELLTAVNGLKYNFHVKVNADPLLIKMRYEGVNKLSLKDGALTVNLDVNGVVEQKPYAYQLINGTVREVKCMYVLKNSVLSFSFPEGYDKRYELVIDPVLVFAAQSGSLADNFGMTATYDSQGNLYAGGTTFNNGYPVTTGAYSSFFNGTAASGNTDVVITKYNSAGTLLLYSTYIGGTQAEIVTSLVVDRNDNLCFYGATGSSNFPTTNGAYDATFNGGVLLSFIFNGTTFNNGTDIYLGKFNSSGTSLLASTYLGGSDNDGVNHVNYLSLIPNTSIYEYQQDSLQRNYGDQYRGEIQVDVLNNIYIASSTRSSNFPTVNAYDNSLGGKQDAILAKFNSSLTQLLYCTYLGGSLNECGNSLIIDDNLEVYMTGGTCSSNFPVTGGAHSTTYNGGQTDGFISHFSANGNTLLHSTFVGTGSYDQCYFIQSDKYKNIYVYGQSLGNMPIVNYVNGTLTIVPYNNPGRHQFITRYNSTLATKNMSTVFGSSSFNLDISPSAFAVDKCNNIYLSGWGGDIIYGPPLGPMPLNQATQLSTNGYDFYFMGLDSNASALQYGSYFGGGLSGEHVDGGTSRFDPGGRIYQSVCAGCGGNDDFPVTPGAWPNNPGNPNFSSNCNNGVVKLDFQLQMAVATINTNTLSGCSPLTVTLTNATPPQGSTATYTWDLGNGNTTSTISNPVVTYTAPGTYTVMLTVFDNLTCNKTDRTKTYITVLPKPNAAFNLSGGQCTNTISTIQLSTGTLSANPYAWNFGDGSPLNTQASPSYTYPGNGIYTVTLSVTDINGCKDIVTNTISIFNFSPGAVSSSSLCNGSSTTMTASGGTQYTWTPSGSLSDANSATPIANPGVSTTYTVQILNTSPGYNCGKTLTTQIEVLPTPTAAFSFSINPCGGDVRFFDNSAEDVIKWNWTLSPTKTSTLQNTFYFYKEGGTFTVSLVSTNIYGCKDSKDSVLVVAKPPPINVNTSTAICRGNTAQLNASGGTTYEWAPAESLDFPFLYNPIASPTVNTTYSVYISMNYNNVPCKFLLLTEVDVDLLSTTPVSAYANPILITTGDKSTLIYIGESGAYVSWLPVGSTTPQVGYTVSASPDKPTTYTVVAQRGACEEDLTVYVESYSAGCLEGDAFVPNTFTPNGDGVNDLFKVKGIKLEEVYFAVYNRWGELVFETNDLTKGWDGRYKGKQADVGVFGWYLKAKCLNGEETFKKGNVTLIR
jgi:gliding motility-associated-like protein